MCNISNRRARGNYAKPRIEGSEFAQKRLERRLTQPSFLWTRRILQGFQAIQNQQGPTMRDELCNSISLLPGLSNPSPGNDCYVVYPLVRPGSLQEGDILLSPENIASRQSGD